MSYPHIPEGIFPVMGLPITTTNGATNADYISLKNVEMCWAVVTFFNGTASTDATTLRMDTAVGAATSTPLVNTVPIWYGVVTAASTQLAQVADGVGYTTADVAGTKIMVFEVSPAALGIGYDCLSVAIAASGHADDFAQVLYFVLPRYPRAVGKYAAAEFIVD